MLYTIMLVYSFTADRAVHAVALRRPPIQRSYAVAQNNPSASPGSSLADIQSSLALIQTTQADQGASLALIQTTQADQGASLARIETRLQGIETTQADQGADLKGTHNKVVSAACSVPLASCFALLEVTTTSTFGKHILSTAELCTVASQTIAAAGLIFGVLYTVLEQIQKNQKTP
jgi:cell pole-organizing protein PopZ